MIGKLQARTAAETNRALLELLARDPGRMRTITADNGTQFHWYGEVEEVSPVKCYFATRVTAGSAGSFDGIYPKAKAWHESLKTNAI
ncbi:MAG: hypothetical protein ABI674_06110 [Spartobacteria bacterium]